jgi:transcriptional regulator with XRE-family HTH domain
MEQLVRLRELKGFSQRALAKESGVSPATIYELENGRRRPNPSTLRKLAGALDVEVAELLGAEYPKEERRSSLEPSFEDALAEERRSADAEVIADYERIAREHRIAWRDALNALAEPWEKRLATGAFDRGAVEQFFADVAAISQSVSRALRASFEEGLTGFKYKAPPTRADIEEVRATDIASAGARLLDVADSVYAAAAEKFSRSELEVVRRKRDEARRAFGQAA